MKLMPQAVFSTCWQSGTSKITPSIKHGQSAIIANSIHIKGRCLTSVKLDEVCDFPRGQVDADCVIDLDEGVWVTDGAGVVGHQVRDALGANDKLPHFAQLVLQRIEKHIHMLK